MVNSALLWFVLFFCDKKAASTWNVHLSINDWLVFQISVINERRKEINFYIIVNYIYIILWVIIMSNNTQNLVSFSGMYLF